MKSIEKKRNIFITKTLDKLATPTFDEILIEKLDVRLFEITHFIVSTI